MRKHTTPRQDRRRKPNGHSLRGSWPVGCIPATNPRARRYLHQAQRSLSVVVIAKRVWTAVGTTDIFFDGPKCKDSVARRHRAWAKDDLRDRLAMDPMRSWRIYVLGTDGVRYEGSDGDLLSDPWLYFLAMLEWAMAEAQREYAPIVAEMQGAINNGYALDILSFPFLPFLCNSWQQLKWEPLLIAVLQIPSRRCRARPRLGRGVER